MTTTKRDFPRSWRWNDDGDKLGGVLVGLRWVQSKQNPGENVPVITLATGQEDVSVWLSGSLGRKMEAEAPRYGDTLHIERGGLVDFTPKGSDQVRQYREWGIAVERKVGSDLDLAGPGLPQPYEAPPNPNAPAASNDDIPF